jgi:Lon protease-like protein
MTDLLPLFPLYSVLFPGMPLQLQIFESRYKDMLQRSLAGDHTFGVVLIKRGVEAYGPTPEPYRTGCRALIHQVQPLADGRTSLVAIGQERFNITSIEQDQPYLVARVEYRTMHEGPASDLRLSAAGVADRLLRYARSLKYLGQDAVLELPDDWQGLAYRVCSLLQLPLDEKQALLELDDLGILLQVLQRKLMRELALLPALLASGPDEGVGSFGLN